MAGKPRIGTLTDLVRSNIDLIEKHVSEGRPHSEILQLIIDGKDFNPSIDTYRTALKRVRMQMRRPAISTSANAPKVVAPESSGGGAVTADGNVGKGIAPAKHTPAKSASIFEKLLGFFKHDSKAS